MCPNITIDIKIRKEGRQRRKKKNNQRNLRSWMDQDGFLVDGSGILTLPKNVALYLHLKAQMW